MPIDLIINSSRWSPTWHRLKDLSTWRAVSIYFDHLIPWAMIAFLVLMQETPVISAAMMLHKNQLHYKAAYFIATPRPPEVAAELAFMPQALHNYYLRSCSCCYACFRRFTLFPSSKISINTDVIWICKIRLTLLISRVVFFSLAIADKVYHRFQLYRSRHFAIPETKKAASDCTCALKSIFVVLCSLKVILLSG